MSTTDRYTEAGLRSPNKVEPTEALTVPDYPFQGQATAGGPSDSWTVANLRGYALARQIDLTGASRKADVLAAIAAHADANTPEETR